MVNSVEFKFYSKRATSALLAFFEKPDDTAPLAQFEMKRDGDFFKTSIKKYALIEPLYYGFYICGDEEYFHPEELAYDPYSLEIVNGKSVYFTPKYENVVRAQNRPFGDEIIGEVHLNDLTINADIKETGTFLGAAKMAQTLKYFGITMVEFLPLNEFDGYCEGCNYWGYMPKSYFALKKDYAYEKYAGSTIREFQKMINEFHKLGIKVCMDVVYNHSANDASFRLIDRKTYYKIDENGTYSDNSCCGNDINCANSHVQNLIADSVAHYAKLGVDAFRFDLAAALLDTNEGYFPKYDSETSLASKLPKMLEERGVKVCPIGGSEGIHLIAEPWTCGGRDCYQLGKFPKKYWWEWNDVARNTLRANSLRPQDCDPMGLRNLIEGSPEIYSDYTRSINFISSHDGLTLNDLNSYYIKGWEISGDYYGNFDAQVAGMKKQIALLMLSNGATMLSIGDLIAHSKGGNNNSYNIPEINYLDFSILNNNDRQRHIFDFWMKMMLLRKNYKPQHMEKIYLTEYGNVPDEDFWENKEVNFFSYKGYLGDKAIYVATSKSDYETNVVLPKPLKGKVWELYCSNLDVEMEEESFTMPAHSIAIFVEK